MKYYTYIHYTKDTDKPFYVGKGSGDRYTQTKSRNKFWHSVVAKHGIVPEVMAWWDTSEEALAHEILLISSLKDMGYKLTNATPGGDNPPVHSGSDWAKRVRDKWADPEYRETQRKARANRYATSELCGNYRGEIFVGTNKETGEVITVIGTVGLSKLGFEYRNVNKCVSGERKSHKGYTWAKTMKDKQ